MRFRQLFIVAVILLLYGCTQQGAPQPLPPTAATAQPPKVLPQAVGASATPTPSPTQSASSASPTQTDKAPDTSQPAPTATEPPEAQATPTATQPPAEQPTPTATPAAQTGQTDTTPAAEGCIDKAAFFDDVTIPDNTPFKQGAVFTKTWQIRNEGTCTWDGYKLVYAGGDVMDGKLSNPIQVVKPGELANISVDLKSPPQGGVFTGLWEFENAGGKRFGVNSGGIDYIWVKISVTWYPDPSATPSADTGSTTAQTVSGCTVTRNADYESQILQLINQARADAKLPALKLQLKLNAAALAHSTDMACQDFVDHTGSDGSSWYTRIKAQDYKYSYASENIYVGDAQFGGDAQGAFTWWMNSQIHRDNILNPKATSIGIAYANNSNSTYKGYYTLDFARP